MIKGMRKTQLTKLLNLSGVRPRSAPAPELISRAESSVGIMYHSSGPNTGSNSGGGLILKSAFYRVGNILRCSRKIYKIILTFLEKN